jgi:hypothetical protein
LESRAHHHPRPVWPGLSYSPPGAFLESTGGSILARAEARLPLEDYLHRGSSPFFGIGPAAVRGLQTVGQRRGFLSLDRNSFSYRACHFPSRFSKSVLSWLRSEPTVPSGKPVPAMISPRVAGPLAFSQLCICPFLELPLLRARRCRFGGLPRFLGVGAPFAALVESPNSSTINRRICWRFAIRLSTA